jgi:hypothetical protein
LKRISAILTTISLLSLTAAVFLSIENNDTNRHAIAQQIINESFVNNTETLGELDKILGNNTAIILSDDCMKLPNTKHMYCP